MAVLETVAQVEAAGLAGTAPRQGVTMVEAAALEGATGQAVTVEAAAVEAAAVVEVEVMVEVTSGQGAVRGEVATLVEAVGQAAV